MSIARTIWGWRFFLLTIVALGWLVTGCTQRGITKTEKEKTTVTSDVIKVTAEGTNFCLGCNLKKQKGAGSQCSILGHKHTFKVTKVVGEDGKELTDLRGWVLHYLKTEKGQDLVENHHGEKLTITGRVYPQERVLEVDSFKETFTPEE